MSELKCPFCSQELIRENMDDYWCTCNLQRPRGKALYGNNAIWQELIRTRKALDIAKEALNNIHFTDDGNQIIDIRLFAHHVFDQITTLEQKEHFADASKKIEQKGE